MNPGRLIRDPVEVAERVARRLMRRDDFPRLYVYDLALEGLLWLYDVTSESRYLDFVLAVQRKRGLAPEHAYPWRTQLYVCVNYELYLRTGNAAYVRHFVATAEAFRREVPRAGDGAVGYFFRPEKKRIFIDMLQGYATHMARAGRISGDASFREECVSQYRLFRDVLRDPATGWWSQGRGWDQDPEAKAPGAWLRGQGWVLRGMVESLSALPPDYARRGELLELLREFAATIRRDQDARGLWHQVPYRPETYQETTGTGLFVHYLSRAVREGLLPAEEYRAAAVRGYDGFQGFVTRDGTVLNGSLGCGPLRALEDYLHRPSSPGDYHTPGIALLACAGRVLLERKGPWDARP